MRRPSNGVAGPGFVPMSAYERATGWITGADVSESGADWRHAPSPREALAAELYPATEDGSPLYIAFSGGLDSSLLLAIAADTARRRGLPPPVPVTNTYSGDELADETEWQRLVVAHLGLEAQWQRVPLDPHDDLVGPGAMDVVRRHGICWPVAFAVNSRALCAALPEGSRLVTGDGGDEALGQWRTTALAAMVSGYRPSRKLLAAAARGLAPRPLRRWDRRRSVRARPSDRQWLRPAVRARFLAETLADDLREPLRPRRALGYWAHRRAAALGRHNMRCLAAEHGVALGFPLWADGVTAALQREAGLLGWLSRAAIVDRIAGDLLPQALVNRRTKAVFSTVMFGPSAREVIAAWDGTGLDDDLVDATALSAEWAKDVPPSGTIALLQEVALLVSGA